MTSYSPIEQNGRFHFSLKKEPLKSLNPAQVPLTPVRARTMTGEAHEMDDMSRRQKQAEGKKRERHNSGLLSAKPAEGRCRARQ